MKTTIKISKTSKIPFTISAAFAALAVLATLVSCDKIDTLLLAGNQPEVQIVIGDVTAARGARETRVGAGFLIEPQDVITVGQNSRVKFNAGQNSVYVNENSLFAMASPSSPDSGTVILQNGDYYFAAAGNTPLKFAFGDISVEIIEGTASLMIGDLGRLAEFFVISGRAIARRGNKEVLVGACKTVVFDAAGISEDFRATAGRGQTLNWLAAWVGGPTIRQAADDGGCYVLPFGQIEFTTENEDEIPIFQDTTVSAPPRAPAQQRMAPRRADTRRVNLEPVVIPPPQPPRQTETRRPPPEPAAPAPPRPRVNIENVTGPARVHATEEFTLRAVLSGEVPDGFVWHVDYGDGDIHIHRTVEPRLTTVFTRAGDYIITVEARSADGTIVAARRVRLRVNTGQIVLSAGGPYVAHPNEPALFLGNARSRFSDIVRYEWFLHGLVDPIFASHENAIAHFTFIETGEFAAIYKVTLADGSFATDTARVIIRDQGDTTAVPVVDADIIEDGSLYDGGAAANVWTGESAEIFAPADALTDPAAEFAPAPETSAPADAPAFENPAPEPASEPVTMIIGCQSDMVLVNAQVPFCIDIYEWPNSRGTFPTVNISREEAAATCGNVGKRLCTVEEWTYACRGGVAAVEGERVYPYGATFDAQRCNTEGNGGFAPAGDFARCTNSLSIFDMSGNVVEWVASDGMAFAYGGYYDSGAPGAACDSRIALDRNRQFDHVGFRCCK